MKPLFTATATARGGRSGHAEASDKSVVVELSVPNGMGGPGTPGTTTPGTTTPEHLFATGYAACFGSAVDYVAKLAKKDAANVEVTAAVTLGTTAAGGFQLAVELRVRVPGMPRAEVEPLVQKAHQICPYSNATRGNIEVKLLVVD